MRLLFGGLPPTPDPTPIRRSAAMTLFLTATFIFLIKHFFADFVLQPYRMVSRKGDYLHPAGLAHAGIHAVGSIPALLTITNAPELIAALISGEFIIHYHTDWFKAQLDRRLKLDNTSTLHWAIFGADQLIHNTTYLAMIYVAVSFA